MSLANDNMRVAEILWEEWITQNFSVSAFRSSKLEFNTTSKLIAAGESQNQQTILETLQEISDFHTELLEDILNSCDERIKKSLITYAKDLFAQYRSDSMQSNLEACQESSDYILWVWERAYSLLSIWEVIAAKVFTEFLRLHWIPAVYVDTPNLKHIHPDDLSSSVWAYLQWEFEKIYSWDSQAIPIIPGYIWGIEWWILNTLDRGYTDYTGERAAVSLHQSWDYDEVLFYIQKMYGFKSTDPRKLDNPWSAKSVNKLSYALAKRAIDHNWANAWLINAHALSRDIVSKNIPMLVWNPTDTSDVALINQYWNPTSRWVELVLWRPYNSEYDDRTYNRLNRSSLGHHVVYLMGDNLQKMWDIYARATTALRKSGTIEIAWESKLQDPKEMSFVFKTADEAQQAQRVLHAEFVE